MHRFWDMMSYRQNDVVFAYPSLVRPQIWQSYFSNFRTIFRNPRRVRITQLTRKLLSDNLTVCDHNPPTLQTDGRTDDFPRQYRGPRSAKQRAVITDLFVDTRRLAGRSVWRKMVIWRLHTSVVGCISADTRCNENPHRPRDSSTSLIWTKWRRQTACSSGNDRPMDGTTVLFYSCRHNRCRRKWWSHCWFVFGGNSMRLRFRWRLAVGLLRVWYGRLCLVCLLVFSLLQLALHTSTNIDSWTGILGKDDR